MPNTTIAVGDVAAHLNILIAGEHGVEVDKLRKPITPRKAGMVIRNDLGLKTSRKGGTCKVVIDAGRLAELRAKYGVGDTLSTSPDSPRSCERPSEHVDASARSAATASIAADARSHRGSRAVASTHFCAGDPAVSV